LKKKTKVLITGSAGFVGTNLIKQLSKIKKFEITATYNKKKPFKIKNVIYKKINHVLVRPTRDLTILNKSTNEDEIIDGVVENMMKWEPASHLGFSNDHIQFEERIVNFKDSIIQ